MELEETALVAAPSIAADERAPAVVSLPNLSPHGGGDVTCAPPAIGCRATGGAHQHTTRPAVKRQLATRPFDAANLRLLELCDEHTERPVDDGRWIAIRDLMSQQVLGAAQLGMCFGACRELDPVTRCRRWRLGRRRRALLHGRRGWRRCPQRRLQLHARCRSQRRHPRQQRCLRRIPQRRDWLAGAHLSRGQQPDRCSAIRQRPQSGNQLFHLAFALVFDCGEQLAAVHLRQVRREEPEIREIQPAIGELVQNHRKPARRACGLDSPVRGALREIQNSRAIREQRRAAFSEIQAPLVEYCKVRDERGRRLTLVLCQVFHLCEKSSVGKCCDRGKLGVHDASLSPAPAASRKGCGAHG